MSDLQFCVLFWCSYNIKSNDDILINKWTLPGGFNTKGKHSVVALIFKLWSVAMHLRRDPVEACVKLKE